MRVLITGGIVCFFIFCFSIVDSRADLISPVAADTDDPEAYAGGAGIGLEYIIDGVIQPTELFFIGNEGFGEWHGPFTITFDLGSTYELSSFSLWNNGGGIGNDGEGIQDFELSFYDSDISPVGSILPFTALDIEAEQQFAFTSVAPVQYIDLTIISNHSPVGTSLERGYAVLHEIAFEGIEAEQPIPEPATLLLSAAGLTGFAVMRRRRMAK